MKISDEHKHFGSALLQILRHPTCHSLKSFNPDKGRSRSGFVVNDRIGVFIKYCTNPSKPFNEYVFSFTRRVDIHEMAMMKKNLSYVYAGLVCLHDRQICCLSLDNLVSLAEQRDRLSGKTENIISIRVAYDAREYFKVRVNQPGRKWVRDNPIRIPRTGFPNLLFN